MLSLTRALRYHSEMDSLGVKGQYFCFAVGTWCGSIVAGSVERWFRPASPSPRELPLELLVLLYIPVSLLLASLFAIWIAVRSRRENPRPAIGWRTPFSLGLAYLPLLFGAIPLLIRATGQGHGPIIGSCIAALLLGLPILAGEIAFWFGRPTSAPGRN